MTLVRPIALVVAGVVAGIAFVVACGDDSPGHADGGQCNCPAAEPPLEGRIQRVTGTATMPANDRAALTAPCPDGALILGGGCGTSPDSGVDDVVLQFSHQSDTGRAWVCKFRNNMATPVDVRVSAYCLVPAQ